MTLPKFLLAWSDFNWLWLYAKLRPAKDARWSLRRVMVLTALKAAGGAGFGLILSLLLFRQPTGWLPWLLGLFAGCVGLCWLGVTAICWNQRAAQLQANPTRPTALPRSRFRFGRWCLGAIYLAILGVITPFALLITAENLRGEWAWKREHARLVAAGERLTFREILGPEIPPEQNAGAAKIFAPFFDYHIDPSIPMAPDANGSFLSRVVWPQSNAWRHLDFALQLPFDYLPTSDGGSESRTSAINLNDWSIAFRTLVEKPKTVDNLPPKVIHMPLSGNAARDVLAGLEPAEQVLSDICQAAALPRSQFPIHWNDNFQALLAHLSKIKSAQQALQLRCAAHLAAQDTNAAFSDATNALNVAELLREEPLLISQLVRYAQWNLAVSTLWQGLAHHRWTDAQLDYFHNRLAKTEMMPGLVVAFEGERAAGNMSVEQLIRDPGYFGSGKEANRASERLFRPLQCAATRQNQIALAEFHFMNLQVLRGGIKSAPERGWRAMIDELKTDVFVRWLDAPYSPYRAIAAMIVPSFSLAAVKSARTQTTLRLAATACALERYRVAHGQFPERLGQLVPQFAEAVPLDPMVNQPFKYRRTDDGWFLLYSVGPNGTDEGGVLRADVWNDTAEKDWPWPVPSRPAKVRLF